jgi:RNA polymerase-interacting CarD/CdnL/TRCF family regulator
MHKLVVRVPQDLVQMLKIRAVEEETSLTAIVIRALQREAERRGGELTELFKTYQESKEKGGKRKE